MRFYLILNMLVFTNLSLAMDNRIQTQLQEQGYATFSEVNEGIIPVKELESLIKGLSIAFVPTNPEDEAHRGAHTQEFLINFEKNTLEDIAIESMSLSAGRIFHDNARSAAKKIIGVLPDQVRRGSMKLILYSELEEVLSREANVILEQKSGSYEPTLRGLHFHQDVWEGEEYFDYLFFQVLRVRGFTPHFLTIAEAKEGAEPVAAAENHTRYYKLDDLKQLAALECKDGAGYIIEQKREPKICHSRTETCTVLTYKDTDKAFSLGFSPEEAQKFLCLKHTGALPQRIVMIGRINIGKYYDLHTSK